MDNKIMLNSVTNTKMSLDEMQIWLNNSGYGDYPINYFDMNNPYVNSNFDGTYGKHHDKTPEIAKERILSGEQPMNAVQTYKPPEQKKKSILNMIWDIFFI